MSSREIAVDMGVYPDVVDEGRGLSGLGFGPQPHPQPGGPGPFLGLCPLGKDGVSRHHDPAGY